ncbi:MAG TPA: peptide chain release factor N(5)-glutamine methyltransferase [Dongiaceae bacterium]|nr:peptide chain release factor N(5)-glutamine methyltransferase [Dongiaceae bacterium]
MTSLAEAQREVSRRLAPAGIPEPRREARLLVAAATGLSQAALIADPERPLSQSEAGRLAELAGRRAAREPLSRILGWREFWSLRFALGPDTLDPRPDSETLIEAALDWLGAGRGRPLKVLDLGTGTGCLLLALLSELPAAEGLGIDASSGAAALARRNAESLGLGFRARFMTGSWGEGIEERFDIVLCNPPYVPAEEIARLEPEVARFDPWLALSGGADGLASYRALARQLPGLLATDGGAFVEIGLGQAGPVGALFEAGGLPVLASRADLGEVPRCLVLGQQKTVGNPRASD